METFKPKQEIIFANVIMCLLVVFIHVSSGAISSLDKSSFQYLFVMIPWRLSAFVVQGFIFLAALKIFIKKAPVTNYRRYYILRFRAIILPYIFWVFIYYIYFCNHHYFPFRLQHLLKHMALGSLVSPFYFIIVIVQFYALLPVWQRLYKHLHAAPVLLASFLITLLFGQFLPKAIYIISGGYTFAYNDRLFTTYLLYWSMGAVCGIHYEKFSQIILGKNKAIFLAFLLFMVIDVYFSFQVFAQGIHVSGLETIHIFYCITAILFTVTLGLQVPPRPFLRAINSISYLIYLSHCYVLLLVNDKLVEQGVTDIGTSFAVRFFGVYTLTISACLIFRWLKNHFTSKKIVIK